MVKFQYFGDLMQRANSLEKTLMLGKIESMRKNGQGRGRGRTEDEMVGRHQQLMDMSLSKLREMVKDKEVCCAAVHGGHKELDTTY